MTIRLMVVDDQAAIREALAVVLDLQDDIEVVGTADNGQQAVELAESTEPDVVLIDLNMPVLNGVDATRQILAARPATAIVVLTTFADDRSIIDALGAGAKGYLTKDAGREDIARAVRAAAAGQAVLDPAVQARLVAAALGSAGQSVSPAPTGAAPPASSAVLPTSTAAGLTAREYEVLSLIAHGLTNGEIASRIFVSEATVKTHINNLFAKAQLRDRAHAVNYAFTAGLVQPLQ